MVFEDRSLAPYHGSEPYIFISYSHRNADRAAGIISRLNRSGFRVWYDEGLIPGREWDDNIARIIMGCGYFVALLTEEYLASSNCKDELNFARDKNKPLLLLYLDEVSLPAGMELRLGRLFAVHRAQYGDNEDAFYAKMFSADGIARCNARYTPPAASGTASARRSGTASRASAARNTASSSRPSRVSPERDAVGKPTVDAEASSSGHGLQVFGVILLLALLAVAAFLLYRLFGTGGSTPSPTLPPPVYSAAPAASEPGGSNEAVLDIEATTTPEVTPSVEPVVVTEPIPSEVPVATPTPVVELTPSPLPVATEAPEVTAAPVQTPELTPIPVLEPTPTPTPAPTPTPTPTASVDDGTSTVVIVEPDGASTETVVTGSAS